MKFKLMKLVPLFLIAFALTACGDKDIDPVTETETEVAAEVENEETTLEEETEAETEESVETETEAATEAATEAVTQAPAQASAQAPAAPVRQVVPQATPVVQNIPAPAQGSLGVTLKGSKIMLNSKISDVAPLLGSTTNYEETPSVSQFTGVDKTFTYGKVKIYTYPHPQGDYIDEIEVSDPSVITSEGIAPIGKHISEVTAVCGEPSFFDETFYVYEGDDCYTYYSVADDIVQYWGVVVGYL